MKQAISPNHTVLSLKSPSRTMESPDGASPSTWAPWTKAWPPGAFHQVLGSRPISGRVHRSLALLACHWSIESLFVCLLTQDQFTLGDPSRRQRDHWGTQSAPPCQGGDSQRGQQQHGFHFVNYHLHWSNQFNRSFPLAYPNLLGVNKMINQTALLPNKRVPWFLCQIWFSLVTLGYRKSQKRGAALVHCGWATITLETCRSLDSILGSFQNFLIFPFAFWNALTKMSKKLFKKASSRVRECNHNSCVRNNVLLFSLHKFHYAWVFLFFLYVKHVLRALILLSLQHCSHPNVWMFLTLLCVSLHCPNQLLLVVFIPFEIFCEIACQPLTDWQETKIGHPLIMWSPPPPPK